MPSSERIEGSKGDFHTPAQNAAVNKIMDILFHTDKYVPKRKKYTMNFKQMMEYMESIKGCGIVPGLSGITELCKRLGNPQDSTDFVHIAGTNGKGSVLAFLSSILKCAGYRVGSYHSPAVFSYCERLRINGRAITKKALCECMEEVKAACDAMTADGLAQPTPFEVETAAAFLYFQKNACDIVVLETGMGGREDATNLVNRTKAAVLTPISMDHMQFLGDTPEKIAAHKAGIIKNGCYVITAKQKPEILPVIEKEAAGKQCRLTVTGDAQKIKYGLEKQSFSYQDASGKRFEGLEISLAGKYQIENAALAVETVCSLALCGYPVSEKQLRKGLAEAVWQGRFQIAGKKPFVVLDGAHNEDAAKKLAESIRFYFTNKRIIYIMGMLKDKECEKVVAETYAYAEQIITVTPPDNPRALPAMELARIVKEYHPHVTAAGSLEEGVEMAYLLADKADIILCFGSLSYLGHLSKVLAERPKDRRQAVTH